MIFKEVVDDLTDWIQQRRRGNGRICSGALLSPIDEAEAERQAIGIQVSDVELRTRIAANGNKDQAIAGATTTWLIGVPHRQALDQGAAWGVETEQACTMLAALVQIDAHRRREQHPDLYGNGAEMVFTPIMVLIAGKIDQRYRPAIDRLIGSDLWIDFPNLPTTARRPPSQRERLVTTLAAAWGRAR